MMSRSRRSAALAFTLGLCSVTVVNASPLLDGARPSSDHFLAQSTTSDTKAEIATKAYDPADARPRENWFGCPPGKAGENGKTQPVSKNCDPDAAVNHDPAAPDGGTNSEKRK